MLWAPPATRTATTFETVYTTTSTETLCTSQKSWNSEHARSDSLLSPHPSLSTTIVSSGNCSCRRNDRYCSHDYKHAPSNRQRRNAAQPPAGHQCGLSRSSLRFRAYALSPISQPSPSLWKPQSSGPTPFPDHHFHSTLFSQRPNIPLRLFQASRELERDKHFCFYSIGISSGPTPSAPGLSAGRVDSRAPRRRNCGRASGPS